MEEATYNNASKAIIITTTLTILIAGAEIANALRYYETGMNLLDIASYVQANPWFFGFTFIFINLVMLPGALLLYKSNGINIKKEIFEKETLACDILWGILLMVLAAVADLAFQLINLGRTNLAFNGGRLSLGMAILYFFSLVPISGICKEIYFRGFAKHFCGSVFGETCAFLLFNMLFGLLDWYNMGYSFVLGLICIWGYRKRKHLIVPMIIHGGVNLIGIVYMLVMQSI